MQEELTKDLKSIIRKAKKLNEEMLGSQIDGSMLHDTITALAAQRLIDAFPDVDVQWGADMTERLSEVHHHWLEDETENAK